MSEGMGKRGSFFFYYFLSFFFFRLSFSHSLPHLADPCRQGKGTLGGHFPLGLGAFSAWLTGAQYHIV